MPFYLLCFGVYLLCYGYVLLRSSFVLLVHCMFVLIAYGPNLRAIQGIIPRLNILVVGSSHRGRDAERNSTPRF